jgi:beta-galactosidase
MLTALRRGDADALIRGPRAQLWRAATDNDGLKLWSGQETKALGRWRKLRLDQPLEHRQVKFVHRANADGSATLTVVHTVSSRNQPSDCTHEQRYTLQPDGALRAEHAFRLGRDLTDLPRAGVRLDLAPGFESLRYFGRGPRENYSDRRAATWLAVHESTVAAEYVPYIMPQEHGHHCDVRWLELMHPEGRRFRVSAETTLEFNATHYPAEELFAARHTTDLAPVTETLLYLDAAHRGLGTASCGSDTLPEHRLTSRLYRLRYTLGV